MHKNLLAAKLVMGQLTVPDMLAAARQARDAGERGEALEGLAALSDASPNDAERLFREWLRHAGVELPSPPEAVNVLFDQHFAALVLGTSDPSTGIAEFMKNVYYASPGKTDTGKESDDEEAPPEAR